MGELTSFFLGGGGKEEGGREGGQVKKKKRKKIKQGKVLAQTYENWKDAWDEAFFFP